MRDMGITEILRKVFLVDLIQGLNVTFRYQDPKEIYTEQYPLERPQVAERYRGAPRLNVNPDNDETLCISCDLCALACPEHLIVVTSERNEKTRRKELTNFTYDLSRCMFCARISQFYMLVSVRFAENQMKSTGILAKTAKMLFCENPILPEAKKGILC